MRRDRRWSDTVPGQERYLAPGHRGCRRVTGGTGRPVRASRPRDRLGVVEQGVEARATDDADVGGGRSHPLTLASPSIGRRPLPWGTGNRSSRPGRRQWSAITTTTDHLAFGEAVPHLHRQRRWCRDYLDWEARRRCMPREMFHRGRARAGLPRHGRSPSSTAAAGSTTSGSTRCWTSRSPRRDRRRRARPDAAQRHLPALLPQPTATDEQKQRWLPGIASGELITAVAMTEPGRGFGPLRSSAPAPSATASTTSSTAPRPSSPTASMPTW